MEGASKFLIPAVELIDIVEICVESSFVKNEDISKNQQAKTSQKKYR